MLVEHTKPPIPAGYVAVASVTNATAQALTVPDDARYAIVKAITAPVRFRDDGTEPTSVSGYSVATNGEVILTSRKQLDDFRVIAVDTTASLEVLFYKISE
ncbi:hypothetical protein [Methanoculleus sp.]|jgi:hypothetical protein|uniref:hypothetical protein n=1 Tax=Methanoculleus sp. TaxID=90427 RepID=UPI0025CD2B5A|nr:hypothetical protein [Methanoculleus sp.]MCK9320151.1 hypothetical protein [Methanoculleus sp.]